MLLNDLVIVYSVEIFTCMLGYDIVNLLIVIAYSYDRVIHDIVTQTVFS
jgi:hypothetical protein